MAKSSLRLKFSGRKIVFLLSVCIIFIILILDIESDFRSISLKTSNRQRYGEEMAAVLTWLKNNSSPDDVVLSEWTEGNLIVALADRGVVASSKVYPSEAKETAERYKDIKNFFFALNEDEAMKIINKYKVKWIYLRKKPDIASIVKKSEAHLLGTLIRNNQLTQEGVQKTIIGKMLSRSEFSHFQLVVDTPDFLIYQVDPPHTLRLTKPEKIFLLRLTREAIESRLNGNQTNLLEKYKEEINSDKFRKPALVDVALYIDGELRGSQIVKGNSVPEAVIAAAQRAMVDPRFAPVQKGEIKKMAIEIYLLGEKFPVGNINFSAKRPPEYFGTKGFYLEDQKTGYHAYFLPSVFNKFYFRDMASFFSRLCQKAGLEENCFNKETVAIYLYDGQYFAEDSNGGVISFEGTVPIDDDFTSNKAEWRKRLDAAAGWLRGRQLPYGSFITSQYPISKEESEKIDLLRDAFSAYALWEHYRTTHEWESFLAAKLATDFLDEDGILRKQKDGEFEVIETSNRPMGNLTFLILANLSAYELTGDQNYLNAAKKTGDYLIKQVSEQGEFFSSYGDGSKVKRNGSDIVSGQAIVALSRLALVTGDENYKKAAIKTADFEKSNFRSERRLNKKDELSLASKAWLVNAFYDLYKLTRSKEDAEFAIEVADWLLSYQRQFAAPIFKGSFPNTPNDWYAYTAGTGKVAEALVDAYRISKELNLSPEKYKVALELALKWLAKFQYNKETLYFFKPELRSQIMGGLRQDFRTASLRTDYAGHYMMSIIGLLDILNKN